MPAAVVVTCLPCLLVPIVSALVAAGAFGGPLGLVGVPWVLALLSAVAAGAGMLFIRPAQAQISPLQSSKHVRAG